MRRISSVVLLLCGFALLTPGCLKLDWFKRAENPGAATSGPQVGTPAPEIDGVDLDGNRFKLSDYRGKVVVVTFWASWCRPCRELIPHEQSLVERYRGKNFALIGVNMDEKREAALKVSNTCGINWRNWQGGGENNPIPKRWHINALPTVYVIDAKGIIRHALNSGTHLDNAVESLLAEAESKR